MSERVSQSDMEQVSQPKTKFRPWFVLMICVGMFALAVIALTLPAMLYRSSTGDRAFAVSNAKQVGLALFTFQEDFGSFPSATTAAMVKNNHPDTTAIFGNTSSNDFFRQLIASGMMDLESPFYTRTPDCRTPDDVQTGTHLLEKGEVGFAYVVSHAACKAKDFPIILTPLVKEKLLFDGNSARQYFDGKVIVLWADNSCTIESVDKAGRVILNGKDFFDPSQPYWHGIPPKVAWPE